MKQTELSLISRLDGPSVVPPVEIAKITSYREACRMCWVHRRVQGMTKARLAEVTGMRPSHISEYFSPDLFDTNGRELRDMPGKYVKSLERVAGNTFISQWHAMQSNLTVLESIGYAAHQAA